MTSDTWQFIADMVDGKTPIKRSNPKPGESAYYYLNPNDDLTNATWFTERQHADVNSPNDPNPFVTWTAGSGTTGTGTSATTPTGTDTITSGGFDTSKWMSAFQKPTSSTVGAGTTNTGFGSTTTTGTSFGTTPTGTGITAPTTRTYEDIPPLGFANQIPEDTRTEEQKRQDNPFYDAVLKYAESNNVQFGSNGMNSQPFQSQQISSNNWYNVGNVQNQNTDTLNRQQQSEVYNKDTIYNAPNMFSDALFKINPFEFGKKVYSVGSDMVENYLDMRSDNTEGNDNYFHCKANFEAAKRGLAEANIATGFNYVKEIVDFPKNIIFKGLSIPEAVNDFKHDMTVDNYGLYRGLTAKEGEEAQEACQRYRVNGINARY